MAERPNVKDILAAARRGGAAKPADDSPAAESVEAPAEVEESIQAEAPSAPAPAPAAPLGRPMTLKEKLAAARSGGAATPGAAPAPAAKKAAPAEVAIPEETAAAQPAAPKPAAAPLGRPMTMAEKLAAARGGGAPAASPAGAKPAAAKPAAAAAAKAVPASARELPPLDKITDPRDLAEALRRAGADQDKAAKADAASKAATAAGATPGAAAAAAKASALKKLESKTVPPKPSKDAATAPAPGEVRAERRAHRRAFLGTYGWIIAGWGAFAAAAATWGGALSRFMFPNVLAEPPSTIKVGLPSNFEPEQVNERWKAEWGFWIVRSANYDGEDKIYAIQSVCTHLGCPPNWLAAEAKFKCPCHGSGFYVSGVNFEGPAPRPLERFKVSLNDAGEMIVDKSQKYQEELKQWSDPDSYIVA